MEMKLNLNQPGAAAEKAAADVSKQEQPAVQSQAEVAKPEPKAEPSAAEQLEAAQTVLKHTVAAQAPELLSPAAIALVNAQIKATVSELLGQFLPMLEKLKAPSPKEAAELEQIEQLKAREKRERAQGQLQDQENRRNLLAKQRACRHLDGNSRSSVSLMHNFPDRNPRGICVICQKLLEPRHYMVVPPSVRTLEDAAKFISFVELEEGVHGKYQPFVDSKTGIVTHFLVSEDSDYGIVRELEARLGVSA